MHVGQRGGVFRGIVIIVSHRAVPAGVAHQERDGYLGILLQIKVARRAVLHGTGFRCVEDLVGGVEKLFPVLFAEFIAFVDVVDPAIGVVIGAEPCFPAVIGHGCRFVPPPGAGRRQGRSCRFFGRRGGQHAAFLFGGEQRLRMDVGGVDIGFGEVGRKFGRSRETPLGIGDVGVEGFDSVDFFVSRSRGVFAHGRRVVDFEIDCGVRSIVE